MASPQLEKGFMRIAIELLEALALIDLNQNETKVLLIIMRQTYGWKKKQDAIPLSQFSHLTGINRKGVCRSLKSLEDRKIIKVTPTGPSKVNVYELQKDYENWTKHTGENYSLGSVTKDTSKPVDKPVDNLLISPSGSVIGGPQVVSSPLEQVVSSVTHSKDNQKIISKGGSFFGGVVENLRSEAQGLKKMGYKNDWIKSHFLTREIPESEIDKAMGKDF